MWTKTWDFTPLKSHYSFCYNYLNCFNFSQTTSQILTKSRLNAYQTENHNYQWVKGPKNNTNLIFNTCYVFSKSIKLCALSHHNFSLLSCQSLIGLFCQEHLNRENNDELHCLLRVSFDFKTEIRYSEMIFKEMDRFMTITGGL